MADFLSKISELLPAISKGNLLGTIISWFFGLGAAVMLLAEFLPTIKAQPITNALKWIGEKANKEVMSEVTILKETITDIQKENAERYAVACRSRILQFGDEIRRGSKHSKESFDQILEYIDNYERYCREHPNFKNNKTHLTTKKILEVYSHSMDQDDFL